MILESSPLRRGLIPLQLFAPFQKSGFDRSEDPIADLPADVHNVPMVGIAAVLLQQVMLSGDAESLQEAMRSVKTRLNTLGNMPKSFSKSFQGEGVLDCFIATTETVAKKRTGNRQQALQQSLDILTAKPFTYFSLLCFLRAKAILQLQANPQRYRYLTVGNELDILEDYQSEVRGVCLELAAASVSCQLTIQAGAATQTYGAADSSVKLELTCTQRSWKLKSSVRSAATYSRPHPKLDSDRPGSLCRTPPEQSLALKNIMGLGILSIGTRQNIPTSRFRCCNLCGKEKKERFCQCRKFRNTGKQNDNNA